VSRPGGLNEAVRVSFKLLHSCSFEIRHIIVTTRTKAAFAAIKLIYQCVLLMFEHVYNENYGGLITRGRNKGVLPTSAVIH
jgi:hypothetical protein